MQLVQNEHTRDSSEVSCATNAYRTVWSSSCEKTFIKPNVIYGSEHCVSERRVISFVS